jgi:hypothetical protein
MQLALVLLALVAVAVGTNPGYNNDSEESRRYSTHAGQGDRAQGSFAFNRAEGSGSPPPNRRIRHIPRILSPNSVIQIDPPSPSSDDDPLYTYVTTPRSSRANSLSSNGAEDRPFRSSSPSNGRPGSHPSEVIRVHRNEEFEPSEVAPANAASRQERQRGRTISRSSSNNRHAGNTPDHQGWSARDSGRDS